MRILVLGGTRFLGRAVVESAMARGHELVLFHRGLSNPGLWPTATHVIGDRERDLAALDAHSFDAVIDTSAFEVFTLKKSIAAARGVPYVFVSSVSVYSDLKRMDEDGPVQTLEDADTAELTIPRYGALKAACERQLGANSLCVRAGKIDGPHDIDERFHWWATRIAEGGEVLAPGDPDALVQTIDVRDLADWMVACVEHEVHGVINCAGEPMTMRTMLETLRDVTHSDATFTWVKDEVLVADGVRPYSEMPYWLPASIGASPVPIERAKATGLRLRPFAQTAKDYWVWARAHWDEEASIRARRRLHVPAGIDREREARLIRASGARPG
jgi:2'-hydroxyisoflavone reductase